MALPPGPEQHPLLQAVRWMRAPLPFLDECAARYGDAFTLRFPALPRLVVFANPEAVREIFGGDSEVLHAGAANVVLRPFLGAHSVLQLDGAEHLRQRRLLLPPFHGERMQAYGKQMVDITDAAIDTWPVGSPFAIHKTMQAVTLEVILRTVFGLEESARRAELSRALSETLEIATWPPLLHPKLQVDLGRFSPWGRFVRARDAADALLFDEMRRRRAAGTAGRTDILSMLLDARDEAGEPMTDQELRDELVTLLVAGHETTATSLAWTFRWLLDTPAALARLQAELATAAPDGVLVPERVAKLEYLDATARESLRLQPVIPMVGRKLARPLRVGGYDLPADTVVTPSIYLAQRRSAAFANPAQFDPERFLKTKPSPYEWFPFGGGVRRCIGMAFALYEMKMVLATTLARVTLRLAPGRPIRAVRRAITLVPSGGAPVVVTARKPRPQSAAPSAPVARTASA